MSRYQFIRDHHITFAGIDVVKHSFDMATTRSSEVLHSTYDERGLRELVKHLRKAKPELIVLEATGGLERRLHRHLVNAGFNVAIVNPRQVRDFPDGIGVQPTRQDRPRNSD